MGRLTNLTQSVSNTWGLRTKAIVLAIALGTLPVLGIGATAFTLANRSITEQMLASKKAKAIALADKVNSFMFERYGDIQIMASLAIIADPRISKLVSYQQKQQTLNRYIKYYKVYDSIVVADLTGKTILQGTGIPVTDIANQDYFQSVLKTNLPVISPPRKSDFSGEISMFIAAPVKDITTGKVIGVIRSRMPVKNVETNIKRVLSGNEQYYVIDASGKFLMAHQPEQVGKEAALEYPFYAQLQTAKTADVKVETSTSDKTEKLVAIAPTQDIQGMPNPNWVALIDTDAAIAFQTQRELLVTIAIGTVLTAIIVSAIAAMLASRATKSITEIVNVVASSSSEIATTVQQQQYTANQQATSVNQTTTTMAQLNANSQQSAEQAEAAAAIARKVLALVDSSMVMDKFSIAGELSLRDTVGEIAQQIQRLSEQVSQIYNITNLVSNLATQTNMLALNAAVEAVRAGDHGRGFGVVAAEIRNLADQSKKSAEKINGLIADIQNATNSTVMVTNEGRKTVESIVDAINNIAITSQQISLNAKQQSIAIQQVLDTMSNLNLAAKQTADGITQTKIATQNLKSAAINLKAVVD